MFGLRAEAVNLGYSQSGIRGLGPELPADAVSHGGLWCGQLAGSANGASSERLDAM